MISVVIPARNEELALADCLASITSQRFKNYELIVVDNQSTDNTSQVASQFGAKVVIEYRKGPAFARQRGFKIAKGEILATIDADNQVLANWLKVIDRKFKADKNLVCLFGWIIPQEKNLVDSFLLFLYNLANIFCYYLFSQILFVGPNQAIRRDVFEKIGGFSEINLPNTHCDIFDQEKLFRKLRNYGKIAFSREMKLKFSMRRFHKEGYFKTFFNGCWLWLNLRFLKKPVFPEMKAVRLVNNSQLVRTVERYSFLVFAVLFTFLPVLFFILFWPAILGILVFKVRQS